jgi:hypothetical protein
MKNYNNNEIRVLALNHKSINEDSEMYGFEYGFKKALELHKKEIAEYAPKTNAEEAITLFNFYQKESCEIVNGLRVPVREEYLEQYKTMESWLKNKHNDYKVIDNN